MGQNCPAFHPEGLLGTGTWVALAGVVADLTWKSERIDTGEENQHLYSLAMLR